MAAPQKLQVLREAARIHGGAYESAYATLTFQKIGAEQGERDPIRLREGAVRGF
jgi:hypothetical protein